MSITTKCLLVASALAGAITTLTLTAAPAYAGQCITPTFEGEWLVRGSPPVYPGQYLISAIQIEADCVDDSHTDCRWDEEAGETVCSTTSAVRQQLKLAAGESQPTFDGNTPPVYGPPVVMQEAGDGWSYIDTTTGGGNPSRIWIHVDDQRVTGFFDVTVAGQRYQNWVNVRRDWMGPWDASGDHRDDLLLSPADGWRVPTLAVALPGGGFAEPQYPFIPSLWDMVAQGGRMLVGDFNGDHRQDITLVGGTGWNTVPVFFRRADGGYDLSNQSSELAYLANNPGAQTVIADLNGDGRDDIAIAGGAGWNFTAIGVSLGGGAFDVTRERTGWFTTSAAEAGARLLAGDFDRDRRADLALVGGYGWNYIAVRFSRLGGIGFATTRSVHTDFASYAVQQGAKPVTGDFDGDGRTDIALTGGLNWRTIPVATSLGSGNFSIANDHHEGHAFWAVWATQGATPFTGDFDDDGRDDLALVGGGPGWSTVPIAYGNATRGYFFVTNRGAPTAAALATIPGVTPVTRVVRP